MKIPKLPSTLYGNGDSEENLTIELATGYQVEIDPENPEKSFQHLGNALMGEMFLPNARGEDDFQNGYQAVIHEVFRIVDGCSERKRNIILTLSFLTHFLHEYEVVHRKLNKDNTGKA